MMKSDKKQQNKAKTIKLTYMCASVGVYQWQPSGKRSRGRPCEMDGTLLKKTSEEPVYQSLGKRKMTCDLTGE